MLNIATIHAITKTSSLPKPLKTLLLSLAASDLGVGLLVQPLLITLLVQWLQQLSPSCIMYTSFSVTMNLFLTASLSSYLIKEFYIKTSCACYSVTSRQSAFNHIVSACLIKDFYVKSSCPCYSVASRQSAFNHVGFLHVLLKIFM